MAAAIPTDGALSWTAPGQRQPPSFRFRSHGALDRAQLLDGLTGMLPLAPLRFGWTVRVPTGREP